MAGGLARAWLTGSAGSRGTLLISGIALDGLDLCSLAPWRFMCSTTPGSRPHLPGPRMARVAQRPAIPAGRCRPGFRRPLTDQRGTCGGPCMYLGDDTDDGERSKRPATTLILLTPPVSQEPVPCSAQPAGFKARRRHLGRPGSPRISECEGTNQVSSRAWHILRSWPSCERATASCGTRRQSKAQRLGELVS